VLISIRRKELRGEDVLKSRRMVPRGELPVAAAFQRRQEGNLEGMKNNLLSH
jgi:hypothetical protein